MVRNANDRFDIKIPSMGEETRLFNNPFTQDFLEEELDFYALADRYTKGGIDVRLVRPQGRVDDYLNKNFRTPQAEVPVLTVDGALWMSLTNMEIQSMFVPLCMAHGVVGTAGLGLGYYALRAASMDRVDRVEVFEMNPGVIQYFADVFGDRKEMRKIEVFEGDAREGLLNRPYDLVFMDIYQTLLGDEVVEDARVFGRRSQAEEYRFWGQEKVLLDALVERDRNRPRPNMWESAFFQAWEGTKEPLDPRNPRGEKYRLADLYEPGTDREFRTKVFEALGIAR